MRAAAASMPRNSSGRHDGAARALQACSGGADTLCFACSTSTRFAPFSKQRRKRMSIIQEFKEFAIKGNMVDLAVAVIIGGAFGKIIDSLVKDVIMPVVGLLLGGVDFSNLFITLGEGSYATLAEAEKAGAA